MNYWLVKSDPEEYGWAELVRDKFTTWTGVRNFTARNNLKAMKKGDKALFYHSQTDKAIVGITQIRKEFFPDATAKEGDWVAVELSPEKPFKNPVTLAQIKADKKLSEIALVRQGRLSVMPLKKEEYERILSLSEGK